MKKILFLIVMMMSGVSFAQDTDPLDKATLKRIKAEAEATVKDVYQRELISRSLKERIINNRKKQKAWEDLLYVHMMETIQKGEYDNTPMNRMGWEFDFKDSNGKYKFDWLKEFSKISNDEIRSIIGRAGKRVRHNLSINGVDLEGDCGSRWGRSYHCNFIMTLEDGGVK